MNNKQNSGRSVYRRIVEIFAPSKTSAEGAIAVLTLSHPATPSSACRSYRGYQTIVNVLHDSRRGLNSMKQNL